MYFEQEEEANTFYQLVNSHDNEVCAKWERKTKFIVQLISESKEWNLCKDQIARFLSTVYIMHRELPMIESILKKKYYFTNEEEIERITSIARSLLEKDECVYEHRIHQHELRDTLSTIFSLHLEPPEIRFDSIVHFRLHLYIEQLTEMIGLAIDEFKREEDYQSFIHSLREFIKRKAPEEDVVHVVQGETFEFYRGNGSILMKHEVEELRERFPLFIFGLEHGEWNISPLIMLAPKHVIMYGNNPQEAQTHTVMNIFQEKFSFYPLTAFPFSNHEQKES
ncbi:sporulation protein YtxC [Gracilibacillus sp. YIM 98692]|uniref:sporulation protein YtxC n=1 Tax=Gracilibacillus sp. YIM 98692 TaxID=2663532 RepID=UPI001F08C947|nr:sporulation protein YtxC [Gracilibacillus sp. YIM 98692]